jgi:hypothetical protein|tara:strand:- start:618 stop:1151 length:534 start_codon:yes stop_codon:yes gene_type:complete
MARSNISLDFPVPDFARIREEAGVVTERSMRSMYFALTDTRRRLQRIQQELAWQSVPFLAGNFTANTGTWTVASADQKLFQFIKIGASLTVSFFLEDTTTGSGMGNRLEVALPKGMTATAVNYTGSLTINGTIDTEGYITTGGTSKLYLFKTDHSSWPSSTTNDLDVRGTISLQVAQ